MLRHQLAVLQRAAKPPKLRHPDPRATLTGITSNPTGPWTTQAARNRLLRRSVQRLQDAPTAHRGRPLLGPTTNTVPAATNARRQGPCSWRVQSAAPTSSGVRSDRSSVEVSGVIEPDSGPSPSCRPMRSCNRRSGAGAHQLASPASFMNAGTRSAAHHGGVDQHGKAEPDAEHLDEAHVRGAEGEERDGQQSSGRRDDASGAIQPEGHRLHVVALRSCSSLMRESGNTS